jgi:hypothetical protein|tara:strand:+ start:62 stop:187 length:126 start_codon:yes stop_codon:yes gene_type:complete
MEQIIITFALIIIIFWVIHFIKRVSLACKPEENAGATGMRK